MRLSDSRLFAIAACLLWSTAFLGVKTGLQYMTPLLFAGIRFFLAGAAVGLISRRKGYWQQVRTHWKMIISVGFFQTFLLYAFFYFSLNNMRASTGAIVNGVGPLATALMAHFFMPGDRLNSRRLFSLVLGVLSVGLITWSGTSQGESGRGETLGIVLMGISLLANGVAMVVVARSSDDLDPFVLNSSQLIFGGMLLLATGLISGGMPETFPPPVFFGALLWLVCVTAGGFSIWYYLLKIRKEKVSHVTVWKFLIPVGGSVLSWLFIGNDSPDFRSIGGMVLTAFSLLLFYANRTGAPTIGKEMS